LTHAKFSYKDRYRCRNMAFSLKKSEKSTFVDKWKSVELGFVFRYWNKTKLIPQRTTSNKSLFL